MPSHPLNRAWAKQPVAVLASGGLDSAVLLGLLQRRCPQVTPLYVRCGLAWEEAEEAALRKFVAALNENLELQPIAPVEVFHNSAREVYGDHWSVTGEGAPDLESSDDSVFLPGRNMMLLLPASLWCHRHHVSTIALGSLSGNPFSDSSSRFDKLWQSLTQASIGCELRIVRPFAKLSKQGVLQLGRDLPLHLTLSCIAPRNGQPCGACNKCAESAKALAQL